MRIGGRGTAMSLITSLIWYGLWVFGSCVAWFWCSHASAPLLDYNLPIGLLLACFYWQLVPILSASMGASLDMRKLLAYPIPHGKLFLVDVLLRVTTGAEMMLLLTGVGLGLIRNPLNGWGTAPRIVLTLTLFALGNLLFSSGMRSILERLLARRRVRELMAVVMVCVWMAPRMLMESGFKIKSLGPVARAIQAFGLPWTASAHAALNQQALTSLLALAAWTALAGWFGRAQFERGLRYDPIAAQATPLSTRRSTRTPISERFYRLPGLLWRDPLGAMVEKELRTLTRTPRFRMVFVMGFTFGLMMWLPMVMGRHGDRHGMMAHYFLTVVCAYSLALLGQVTYWNCLGFDRSAASLYFAAPLPLSAVLVGKNVATLLFIYLEVAILTGVTLALRMMDAWEQWVEAVVVIGVCSVYLLAIGNIASMHYPRAMHAERVSQGGTSSRFQRMLFLFYPIALMPVLLAYLARYALDSALAFWLVMALAAGIGGIVYWLALESAVKTAGQRREQILQELSQGEGPVVAG
jgi:ABC-2 type transport system permease protein